MFQDKQSVAQLKVEIVFVSEVSEKISELINTLEGSKYPYGHKLWDELKAVSSTLERYAHGHLPSERENKKSTERLHEEVLSKTYETHGETKTNDFFMALQHQKFSDTALKCMWAPTNSVNAERFFSKYDIIATERHNTMKEETVEICSMLSFNA
ncbi:hypothetical protein PR048_011930, partial [Dryococelus australis]